jgi:hypothetical protein
VICIQKIIDVPSKTELKKKSLQKGEDDEISKVQNAKEMAENLMNERAENE